MVACNEQTNPAPHLVPAKDLLILLMKEIHFVNITHFVQLEIADFVQKCALVDCQRMLHLKGLCHILLVSQKSSI